MRMSRENLAVIFIVAAGMMHSMAFSEEYKVSWKNSIILPFEDAGRPALSLDGKWLAFLRFKGDTREIWKVRSDGTAAKLLLAESHGDYESPLWLPDSSGVLYLTMGNFEMHRVTADGLIAGRLSEKKYEIDNPKLTPDGKRIVMTVRGIDPPGLYAMDVQGGVMALIFSTMGFPFLNVPFAISPEGNTLVLLNGQELIFVNMIDKTIKEKKTLKTTVSNVEGMFWSSNGNYLILENLLYVLATGEEATFLPADVFRYREEGQPDLVAAGPETFSRDGGKVAFTMTELGGKAYRARIKIMDLEWK